MTTSPIEGLKTFDFGEPPTQSQWEQRGYDRACREIAEWIRAQNSDVHPPPDDYARGCWNAFSGAATCIERGDHRARHQEKNND